MERPFRYTILDLTGAIVAECNCYPSTCSLQKWVPISENKAILKTIMTVYEDTRYFAKLRLYNYVTYTKNGLTIPKYNHFLNTDIGKNTPILNF
jgi:hypothetical protein